MKDKNKLIVFLVSILSLNLTLYSQVGRGSGRLQGIVHDESGNPLAGVKIVVQNLKYKTTFKATSDRKGKWSVIGLGSGFYSITVTLEGYETAYSEMRFSQVEKRTSPIDITIKKIEKSAMAAPGIQDEAMASILEEGNRLYEQKEFDEAVLKFEDFFKKSPSVYQVNINIGNCYREVGEYDKAIASYTRILDKVQEEKGSLEDESAAKALVSIGEIYLEQSNVEKAIEYFKMAVENFPTNEVLAYNLGEILFKRGQTNQAIDYLKIAIKIKENWAPPYLKLGYAYLNKTEYKLAVESFKKILELAPDDPQASTIKGLIPKLEELAKKENF